MMRSALLPALCVVFGACTTIKINQDDTSTIEHEAGAEADIISTVNKDPALPAGTGKQVTTFRCSAAEPQ